MTNWLYVLLCCKANWLIVIIIIICNKRQQQQAMRGYYLPHSFIAYLCYHKMETYQWHNRAITKYNFTQTTGQAILHTSVYLCPKRSLIMNTKCVWYLWVWRKRWFGCIHIFYYFHTMYANDVCLNKKCSSILDPIMKCTFANSFRNK